jgi:hypothetical protein
MTDAGATMSREEITAFLASLKKLRDGLDDFNCQLAAIDGTFSPPHVRLRSQQCT